MSSHENEESLDSLVVVDAQGEEKRNSFYFDSKQDDASPPEEDDDAYRLRVYGSKDFVLEPTSRKQNGSLPRFSKRLSHQLRRHTDSAIESLPETPAGWTVLLSALCSAALGYELRLQKSLTKPPITFSQVADGSNMASIYSKMTATADSILSRPIQPSLFVGTRGVISSTAAYLLGGPSSVEEHLQFREIVTSSQDGAKIGVDWEVPWRTNDASISTMSKEEREAEILKGPIRQPVVIILHGINNDSSFGYVKSLRRTYANRGWNAAAMNFRGCGGVLLSTPRGYNAAYTGDLRNLVQQIAGRLDENVPLFLVGNSLGANVLSKYLGEEGLSGTLPACVAGAASLGNPLHINSELVSFPFNIYMALGIKKYFRDNWASFNKMKDPTFNTALQNGLLSTTIAKLDRAVANTMVRNDAFYPFASRIGYKDAEAYWLDASSFRLVRFISVPFLNLTAKDDFLTSTPSRNKLGFCLQNPNVMVVETRCGGHLGWQESPPDTASAFGATSWSDAASADFFDSIIQVNMERNGSSTAEHQTPRVADDYTEYDFKNMMKEDAYVSSRSVHSRL